MENNNPYPAKKIYAETLAIYCMLVKGNEFEWFLNFSEKYCSANDLIWRIDMNEDDGVDLDDKQARLDDIINFVETKGHNFARLIIECSFLLDMDYFASGVVKVYTI